MHNLVRHIEEYAFAPEINEHDVVLSFHVISIFHNCEIFDNENLLLDSSDDEPHRPLYFSKIAFSTGCADVNGIVLLVPDCIS